MLQVYFLDFLKVYAKMTPKALPKVPPQCQINFQKKSIHQTVRIIEFMITEIL
jgi:hypothetical protein